MKIIAIYSIKGGVGKTAACVNLSHMAAGEGAQTLLCDLDPQGSTTYYFRIRAPKKFSARKLLKGGKNIDQSIRGTDYENLDVLPSKLSFRNLDVALAARKHSENRLVDILEPMKHSYDYLFLDCPANISRVTENVLNAADLVLMPLIPTVLSVQAYKSVVKFARKQKIDQSKIYPFFSMVEKRKRIHQETLQSALDGWDRCLSSQIPFTSDIEKMGIHREPVACFRPRSKAAMAYQQLWLEVKGLFSLEKTKGFDNSAIYVNADRKATAGIAQTYLGIQLQPADADGKSHVQTLGGNQGVLIDKILENSPAKQAGLRSDDILLEIDGLRIENPGQVKLLIAEKMPGDKIELMVYRNGQNPRLVVELAEKPDDKNRVNKRSSERKAN